MRFEVKTTAFNASVARRIQRIEDQTPEIVNAIALEFQDELKIATPVVTGNLRNGWQFRPSDGGYDPATVTNGVAYAKFVNYGTIHFSGRFFLENVVARANEIALRVLKRLRL